MTAAPLKKLPGLGRKFLGPLAVCSSRLLLGPDHLVNVDRYGVFFIFREKYQRFYFKDIQGISIVETSFGRGLVLVCSILLPLLLAACLAFSSHWNWNPAAIVFSLFLAGPPAVLLAANLWLGPTCRTTVHTAVQNATLPSLSRLRRVQKVLPLILPGIEAAQGNLDEENLKLLIPASGSPASPPLVPKNLGKSRSAFFLILSLLLLCQALVHGLLFVQSSPILSGAGLALMLAASLFWAASMVQSARIRFIPSLRLHGWFTLAFIFAAYLSLILYYSVQTALKPELSYNIAEWIRLLGNRPGSGAYFLLFYNSFIVAGAGILGFAGLWIQRPRPDGDS